MSGPIKFRLWNVTEKRWTNPAILRINNDGALYYQRDGEHIWVQSTGLIDKNGKEIFEGDVINRYDHLTFDGISFEPVPMKRGVPSVIEWDSKKCGFIGRVIFYGCENTLELDRPGKFKIIGNIFENPELLNEK